MTTPAKIAANRQNALRSTGPRTPEGKAVVSQNAVRHGIFAAGSVIPGLESRAHWQDHLQATIKSLAPIGQVETALAERVALLLWRMRRIATYEQDTTHNARVRSFDETLLKHRPLLRTPGADIIDDVLARLTQARARLRALERFADGAPDTALGGHHVGHILTALTAQLDGFDAERFCAPEIAPNTIAWVDVPDWTVERFARLVDAIARATDRDPDDLVAAATDAARDAVNKERRAQRRFDRQVRELRADRVLPEPAPLDRILRYETHLTRQLNQTLTQLKSLQHARRSSTPTPVSTPDASPHPPEDPATLPLLPLSIAMGRDVGAADATGEPEGRGPVVGVIRAAQRSGGGADLSARTNPPSDPAPPSHPTLDLAEALAFLHSEPSEAPSGPRCAPPAHTEI